MSTDEERLIDFLINKVSLKMASGWKTEFMVKPMDDGGMGSLVLYPRDMMNDKREFGTTVSECEFKDEDRSLVIASLNLDSKGELFELDIWKTTFEPLKKIPEILS